MPPKEKYTDPDLRDEIKEEVKAGDKGGKPGQWSARKAQFMASEYKKRGGGYNEPKDASQKHLSEWTEEQWQTKEGSGNAKREDGIEKRYLPKKAWENMTESEQEETERLKIEGGKEGRQYVQNTVTAKEARVGASVHQEDEAVDGKGKEETTEEVKSPKRGKGHARQAVEDGEKIATATAKEGGEDSAHTNRKRTLRSSTKGVDADTDTSPAKKRKTNLDSEASPPIPKPKQLTTTPSQTRAQRPTTNASPSAPPPGSTTRLPQKGQTVSWKSGAGYTEGEVVEVVTEEKEVEGVNVKGGKGDPRVVVRSGKSGKVAVRMGEGCYFGEG